MSAGIPEETWLRLVARQAADAPPLYAPLLAPATAPDGCFVLARMVQSLDGQIATSSGAAFWIGGEQDILHTHRLRALCDAVVVGAGTVRADDPLLTTRHCPGPSPVRVVIDSDRRLRGGHRLFADGPPTLLLCADDADAATDVGVETLRLRRSPSGGLDAHDIVAGLASRGLRRILVEGGGITVSRFLQAGALDRLHVTVAPLLLGAGIAGFTLPGVARPELGRRLDWTVHRLGEDVLFDIALARTAAA